MPRLPHARCPVMPGGGGAYDSRQRSWLCCPLHVCPLASRHDRSAVSDPSAMLASRGIRNRQMSHCIRTKSGRDRKLTPGLGRKSYTPGSVWRWDLFYSRVQEQQATAGTRNLTCFIVKMWQSKDKRIHCTPGLKIDFSTAHCFSVPLFLSRQSLSTSIYLVLRGKLLLRFSPEQIHVSGHQLAHHDSWFNPYCPGECDASRLLPIWLPFYINT